MAKRPYRPVCKQCGTVHFNFQRCPGYVDPDYVSEPVGPQPPVRIIRRPDPLGREEWGDRFDTYDRQAENVFLNKREAPDAA